MKQMLKFFLILIRAIRPCQHRWEKVSEGNILRSDNSKVGTINILRCRKCGDEKSHSHTITPFYN